MEREFRPLASLRRMYDEESRSLAFSARTLEEWREWRDALRAAVTECVGGLDDGVPLDAEVLERSERDGYVRERVVFNSARDVSVPAWLLVPDGADRRRPAALALHGHGYGRDDIVGIGQDGTERSSPEGYQKDFALQLMREGLVVLAPDQMGFGERREPADVAEGRENSSCHWPSLHALLLGKSMVGLRTRDAMKAVDYLRSRSEVDPDRIGCMGISGGGTITLFTSALDDRVKATVVSGYLNTFRDSIMSVNHCIDNYVPGILKHAEMYDIASLIAPRPLLVESGSRDSIFPIEGTRYSVEMVRRVYELLGAVDLLETDLFEGDHEISGRKAFRWMAEKLGAE